jgi:heat-inducible transcriptional repressor
VTAGDQMGTLYIGMLDERKTAILSAVVQQYISTAQPVGSSHIADAPTVKVSSATVRNEMAVLEHEGYLIQPHTSAGRIPTDKGYRYFVDHLSSPGTLDKAATKQVGEFFSAAHGRLEELLHDTSNLLAALTNNAALVVGPRADAVAVRRVQLVSLSPTLATVVVVFANGAVENSTLDLVDGDDDVRLSAAGVHISGALDGLPLSAVDRISTTGDPGVDRICVDALRVLKQISSDDQVYTGGVSSVARSFDAVDVVRSVLRALEQQFVVVTLVSDIVNRGMSVAIGVEHGVEPLSACSVVVAPVVVDGEHLGSIGVLGPTRMNYPLALATVDVVSEQLAHRIEEG